MQHNGDKPEYRGLRALLLTRVSTAEQEKSYSHAAQERQIREKLIKPLGLKLDEQRHIIHDTYSGLEYRYREALDTILTMAERGEFDVLCMDVLDRGLGRKAIAREVFRMQLRELGVRILTTDPSDHADDDSLEGMVMRFFKGYKAEEEINDFVRRAKNGKREKALGNEEEGKSPQVVGTGHRLYGYTFVLDAEGTRIGYTLNYDTILTDEEGKTWTEVTVVIFIFESAANGVSIHEICNILNRKGIPSPYVAKGIKTKRMKGSSVWQTISVSRMLKNSAYYGEFQQFGIANAGRVAGRKSPLKRRTSTDEQIIISIPAIVTKELAIKANRRVAYNQKLATRHNLFKKDALLRGGFARCAHCGQGLHIKRNIDILASGEQGKQRFYYDCSHIHMKEGKCRGCSISVGELDSAAREKIYKIIRDPSEVDKKIKHLTKGNPIIEHRKQALKKLADIHKEQENVQTNLAKAIRKNILNERSIRFLNGQLEMLDEREQKARQELADEQALQDKYNKLQQEIASFHQQCQEWREQLDDPAFTLSFKFLHDACLYFGITATVWKAGTKPRYEFHSDPPNIMELLS